MFGSASPSSAAQRLAAGGLYRQVGVETGVAGASPHQLVTMLYDGLLEAIAHARGGLKSGDVEKKGRAITKAVRIVDEGLKAALDHKGGGAIARDLSELYDYLTLRLSQANLRNDDALLEECRRLIEPVRDAWASIGAQVAAGGR
jgi:flagellar secretion chaperone FliS